MLAWSELGITEPPTTPLAVQPLTGFPDQLVLLQVVSPSGLMLQ